MSFKNKLAASVFAVSAFAVAGFAQNATPAKEVIKDGNAKIERKAGMLGGGGLQGLLGGGLVGMHQGLGIDLTDQQKAQIKEILIANKPDQKVLDEAKTILRAKFEGNATPEQEVRLQELKTQYSAKAIEVKSKLLAVLTPEQKAQIEQLKKQMLTHIDELTQRIQELHQLHTGK